MKKNDPPIITLTTDFGLADSYVAEMKAAILRHSPDARLLDVSHCVSPGDVAGGAILLERAISAFPPNTVHLGVVDPGVGTIRRILVCGVRDQFVICPDNGLITWAWRRLGGGSARELLWRPVRYSATFHGRDVMAPFAAILASTGLPRRATSRISDPSLLDIYPETFPARRGKIIHIDHFGNAITNIPRESWPKPAKMIKIGTHIIGPLHHTYAHAQPKKPLILFGSSGLLEIAIRDGSAAKSLSLRVGQLLLVSPHERSTTD